MSVEAHVPEIPYHGVVDAHLERWVVSEDVPVHWKEVGRHAASDLWRIWTVDELRVPDGFIAGWHCWVFVTFVEASRIDVREILLDVA